MRFYNNGIEVVDLDSADITGDLAVTGNATVGGTLGVTGNSDFTGTATFRNWLFFLDNQRFNLGTGQDSILVFSTTLTPDSVFLGLGGTSRSLVVAERTDTTVDFAPGSNDDPNIRLHASDETDITKRLTLKYNEVTASAGNGSVGGLKCQQELVTIAVGQGAAGVVTSGNLAPADSLIKAVGVRIVTAPGGGATTLDVGITGSGNLDALIDGISTAVDTTGTSPANNDGTQLPLANASDTTLTLTTDLNVATSDMEVRVVVWYEQFTPPTS